MKIKIPVAEPSIGEEELNLVSEAVKSGWVSSKGKFIEEFEEGFARFIGAKYGIAVSNGTAALHLALKALGLHSENEVIIPTFTFASVINTVIYTAAKPVLVDSHQDYWCVDPKKIEEKISKKTKAIIPVHIYGNPCEMNHIMKIAKEYDLYVIEDCAEAHGTEYKHEKVGTFGDIACFSFYGNKIITTGEGGMCLTNNEELAQKMKTLRDYGSGPEKRYWHDVLGFNYRMTNLQAALGVAQLPKITKFIKRKREIAKLYNSLLLDIQGLLLHPEMSWAKNVFWMYSILVDKNDYGIDRDELMDRLSQHGIDTRRFFYPMHVMPLYAKYTSNDQFPIAEELSSKGISLPSSVNLTNDEIRTITQLITDFHEDSRRGSHSRTQGIAS